MTYRWIVKNSNDEEVARFRFIADADLFAIAIAGTIVDAENN